MITQCNYYCYQFKDKIHDHLNIMYNFINVKDLENIENASGLHSIVCMACLGGKVVFNGLEYLACLICEATGLTTKDENEAFLYSEVNQN